MRGSASRVGLTALSVFMVLSFVTTAQSAGAEYAMPGYLKGYENAWEKDPRAANLAWFSEKADIGLFMHFGPCNVKGNSWREVDATWADLHQRRTELTYDVYDKYMLDRFEPQFMSEEMERIIREYNPTKFDADAIVDLAIECGFKYITITANHVVGRQYIFDTKTSDVNTAKMTPKRDVLAELAEACRKKDIALFVYVAPPSSRPVVYDRYRQLYTEILTNYGPIAGMWIDGIWAAYERPKDFNRTAEMYALIRELQPHCLISFKTGFIGEEDFLAPESHGQCLRDEAGNIIPKVHDDFKFLVKKMKGKPVQLCAPAAGWYQPPKEGHARSVTALMNIFSECHATGSSFLPNWPPQPDGSFHPNHIKAMREFGDLVRAHKKKYKRGKPGKPEPFELYAPVNNRKH